MTDPDLAQIRRDVTEILAALKGNGLGVSEGLIYKVNRNTENIGVLSKTLDRARWTLTGIGLGAGFAGGGVVALIARIAG